MGNRSFQPQAPLGEVDGIPVVLAGVDLTPTGVDVRLRCHENDVTLARDAEYDAAFAAWARLVRPARERGERPPDPPPQPGAFLNDVPLTLTDDAGTAYVAGRKQAAGTGTEWEGRWRFEPPVPESARTLTVTLGDGAGHHVRL